MSSLRLVVVTTAHVTSGVVPSSGLPWLLAALGHNPDTIDAFWGAVTTDGSPDLQRLFAGNCDPQPIMEAVDDGMVIFDLARHVVRSFQRYMPLLLPPPTGTRGAIEDREPMITGISEGTADAELRRPPLTPVATHAVLPPGWTLIDHFFGDAKLHP